MMTYEETLQFLNSLRHSKSGPKTISFEMSFEFGDTEEDDKICLIVHRQLKTGRYDTGTHYGSRKQNPKAFENMLAVINFVASVYDA